MSIGEVFQGSLFAGDLLAEYTDSSVEWLALDDDVLDSFEAAFRSLFDRFPGAQSPNESQTEDDLIWPILHLLGWSASLRQQNLTARGRDDVPDACCSRMRRRKTGRTPLPTNGGATNSGPRW